MSPAQDEGVPVGSPYGTFHTEGLGRHAARPVPFAPSEELRALLETVARRASARPAAAAATNPYALQPDTLFLLEELLEETSPRSIVEFGGGASTRVFAGWAATHGARVISLEHDRDWVKKIRESLSDAESVVTEVRHAPLRLAVMNGRAFLVYSGIDEIGPIMRETRLVLLDGPHASGREPVLYAILSHCEPGTIVVVDDYRHYATRDMLATVPKDLADCFDGVPLTENSHGLFILRCRSRARVSRPPATTLRGFLQSYWRCLRDFRQYGTGA